MSKILFTGTTNGLELWVDDQALERLRQEQESRRKKLQELGGKHRCGFDPRTPEMNVQKILDGLRVNGECWECPGIKNSSRYGTCWIIEKQWPLHRFIFFIVHNPVEMPPMVCHHCDNRTCARVEHLFSGNAKLNAEDRERKGRGVHPGGANGCSKLTQEQVFEIRKNHSAGIRSSKKLASQYGITYFALRDVIVRRTWKCGT